MDTFTNLIGGDWAGASTATVPNVNPSDTGDIVGLSQSSGLSDVSDAIAAEDRKSVV